MFFKRNYLLTFFSLCLLVVLFSSCSNLKYLPEGEKLYTGADVKLLPTEEIKNEKSIKKEAKQMLRPKPNEKVLGLRIKLWIYNVTNTEKEKGIKYWIKNKIGEPPVLFSKVNPVQVTQLINTRLFNKGIFRAHTEYKVEETEKKAKIHYTAIVHEPYVFGKIKWPEGDDELNTMIRNTNKFSRLREGRVYDLERLSEERERIDEKLKENGFYYFNPDYILFNADTNNANKTINISVSIKNEIPYASLLVYHINEVYLIADYTLRADSSQIIRDTILVDNIHYISANKSYRPKTLTRSVFLRKDAIYTRTDHNMTISRLTGMGVFKFVNVRFNEQDSLTPGYLNAYIYLTALPRKSIRGEVEMLTKSNNFLGPSLTVSFSNRNAFNGAELLEINMHGSFETQLSGDYKGLFSYEIGPEINLYLPRFILPFKIKERSGYYIPKTKITAGYDFRRRIQYFDLNALKFSFGYNWRESNLKEHELNPLNIIFTEISNETEEYKNMVNENLLLKRSLEEQFIVGLSYRYTYNQQVIEKKRNQTFFNLNFETSGNVLSMFSKYVVGKNPTPEKPLTVAGAVYSQFIRSELDLRHYRRINQKSKIAGRILVGSGWAYQNSSILPYIKQFFSGGVSSVRAFRSRLLGPGTYVYPDSLTQDYYLEQGGDIKFEANLEYRFNIISILKGAVFFDAGNVWLLRENPAVPGGKFTSNFYKEIGVGTGLGVRIDANFFVLRVDLAFPLRKPWLPVEDRWVVDKIQLGSSSWRGENLLLNIAIGYPF